jgi:transposase
METRYFLGIDISKKNFQAALTLDGLNTAQTAQVENTSRAIHAYFHGLRQKFGLSLNHLIVCMEHTGIYCLPLLDYLVKNKIKVCVEPALRIKQSQGMARGKSDQVDAKRIAQYAYKNRQELKFWSPPRAQVQKLKALLVLRERLIKIKVQMEVPINEGQEYIKESIRKAMIKNCRHTLKALRADIANLEKEIQVLVDQDTQLTEQLKWAQSVPGVGKITALNVIVSTGEFQQIGEAKKFACHAGVAPFEHTSGSSVRGKTRVSKMANMTLKKLLHMAAMSAIQCCEELRVFYQRKVAEGKNKMSVINAVRNKLISRIFVCVKNKRLYQKNYQHALA